MKLLMDALIGIGQGNQDSLTAKSNTVENDSVPNRNPIWLTGIAVSNLFEWNTIMLQVDTCTGDGHAKTEKSNQKRG